MRQKTALHQLPVTARRPLGCTNGKLQIEDSSRTEESLESADKKLFSAIRYNSISFRSDYAILWFVIS